MRSYFAGTSPRNPIIGLFLVLAASLHLLNIWLGVNDWEITEILASSSLGLLGLAELLPQRALLLVRVLRIVGSFFFVIGFGLAGLNWLGNTL